MSYEAHILLIRSKIDALNIKGIKPKEVFGIPVSRVDGKEKIIVGV